MRGRWVQRLPPLASVLTAVLLALFVLPSALNVPQSNPTQTLEFAPVPPDDEEPPPPEQANLASLSLGASSTAPGDAVGSSGVGPGLPPPPTPQGVGERPATKRCVGRPPRQTDDPLAPPCVAYFDGDNGGSTYAGVSREEIRVVMIWDSRFCDQVKDQVSCCPDNTYVDLAAAPTSEDCYATRILRALLRHFNDRYQTYGRLVHGWIWFNEGVVTTDGRSPEQVRAAAAANIADIDPFGGLNYQRVNGDVWSDSMAGADRVVISGLVQLEDEFLREHAGRIYSHRPTIDRQARVYAGHVCRQVLSYPVSFSGSLQAQGSARVLGLLSAEDEGKPQHTRFAQKAKELIEECGGSFALERSYPVAGRTDGVRNTENNATVATGNMAAFQQAGVTTLIWPTGYEVSHSAAGAQLGYLPEWVIAGDDQIEGNDTGRYQDQTSFDGHAWVVTTQPMNPPMPERPCYRAAAEGDPSLSVDELEYACAAMTYFTDLRMLFTGIQVAGPNLTPESMDRGLHAIPPHLSTDPAVPACYFEPGDYTCVKDAAAWYWDAQAQPATAEIGCWLAAQGGRRFTAETWPEQDVLGLARPDDPCASSDGGLNR